MLIPLETLFVLSDTAHSALVDDIQELWEILPRLKPYIEAQIRPGTAGQVIGVPYIADNVEIGADTVIEHGACVFGPSIIGRKCVIRAGAYVRPYCLIEDGCVIGHVSEIKGSWLMRGAHAAHFNYVGDSVIGARVNLAAGVLCANTRLDPHTVSIKRNGARINTGLRKFGALVGDDVRIGCNTVLNPGTIIGKESKVYPGLCLNGVYATNSKITQQPVA